MNPSNPAKNRRPPLIPCQPALTAKVKLVVVAIFFLTGFGVGRAQTYHVHYRDASTDSALQHPFLKDSFPAKEDAGMYLIGLPSLLQSKGYLAASIDSIRYDSISVSVVLYLG